MTNTPNKDHPEQHLDIVREDFEAWATGSVRGGKFWAAGQPKKERDRYAWASWQAAAKRSAERIAYVEKIAEDAIELCTQQANRVMELEAQVEALRRDNDRLTEKVEVHDAIRAHAQNQPESIHDTGNV